MTSPERARSTFLSNAYVVTAIYIAITVFMTWPLPRVMNREIAPDLGDPVFICWVLMWTGGQVLSALSGNWSALHEYWNGNIFYPEPLTIAYSEHFSGQLLQILPIYAATGNVVLCYNLLFLSTFVLCGLGMYLLVRELTDRPLAAFVAGLAFAFAPYRLSQLPHLQMLSSGWMALALFGFRRYFVTRRTRPLVGGAAALLMQNLSCGYYLLFFPPFAAIYCVYEMAQRRLLRQWRLWRALLIAAAAVALFTWPFLTPYLKVRQTGKMGVRSYEEAMLFSADTHALGTVSANSKLWGPTLQVFPKGEGEGFLGFATLALAVAGVVVTWRRAARGLSWMAGRAWQQIAAWVLGLALVVDLAGLFWLLISGHLPFTVNGRPWHDSDPFLIGAVVLGGALIAIVPAARALFTREAGSSGGFFAWAAVIALVLAFGPRLMAGGQLLGTGPFYWLFTYVPGFDGIRVPARFLTLVTLFLAVLAGLGAAALLSWRRRAGAVIVILAAGAILAEGWMRPLATNVRMGARGFELTSRTLYQGAEISALYRYVKQAPQGTVLIEFPFGSPPFEIQSVFYAGFHRKPLVNGYSGFFPESFLRRANFLERIPFDLDAATLALRGTKATLAIVHEGAFADGRGHEISDWLRSIGSTFIASDKADKLFQLR